MGDIVPFRTKREGAEIKQRLKDRRELEDNMRKYFGMPSGVTVGMAPTRFKRAMEGMTWQERVVLGPLFNEICGAKP